MNDLEQMYQQVILDHAKRPHGRGLIQATPGAPTGESHQFNPTCGDEVTLRVELAGAETASGPAAGGDAADVERAGTKPAGAATIARVTWEGQGCSISQASVSVLTDLVGGASAVDAERMRATFRDLMGTKGVGLDDDAEDLLGDATAFTGVSKYPARIKCALLGWVALHDALAKAGALSPAEENR